MQHMLEVRPILGLGFTLKPYHLKPLMLVAPMSVC